ncbi:MAG: Multidrug ABC transporter ATP-binding protein [Promethearchaeota archaeon]|nr:MAG: Multidrug ABC transporter ATP-binding protein [Candidatus Lokiarchaeota archaeon]
MVEKNQYIIETENLSKSYNGIQALKNLSLKVRKNSIFGFLGPNGAGKTTTIKLLLGLIHPTSGRATVFDNDIEKESLRIRSRVGYLPQNPNFYENMTARDILELSLKFYFVGPESEIQKRVEEVLELVELHEKANRPVKGFSGGERQRLGIAQSVIHYPDLLILDEPAASLDPLGRNNVLELMSKLREHTTIFYSTHILDDVQRVSDTVAILNKGKLIAQGPIEELLAGSEGIIYKINLKGDTQNIKKSILNEPYVTNIKSEKINNISTWYVSVNDENVAEDNLLRKILSDQNIKVIEFAKKQYELEEIFLNLIGDDENVRK